MYGLRQMLQLYIFGPCEVGNSAAHFQDTVISAGAKAKLFHGFFQQRLPGGADLANVSLRWRKYAAKEKHGILVPCNSIGTSTNHSTPTYLRQRRALTSAIPLPLRSFGAGTRYFTLKFLITL